MIAAVIEEYESGAWVADITDLNPYVGSFVLGNDTWVGASVSEVIESGKYLNKIVGGAGGLATLLADAQYDGNVSLQAAVSQICAGAGEAMGAVQAGVFLTSYYRLRGTAAQALDRMADTKQLKWWIDRTGLINMRAARLPSAEAVGVFGPTSRDDSVIVTNPEIVQLGGTINGQVIRHIRWEYTATSFRAVCYFVPFLWRSPAEASIYAAQYSAAVESVNGNGSINVIAAGRFGVKNVPLYAGIPGAKITVKPGELVTLGFFGGDPQAPFAVADGQNLAATKKVARTQDTVDVGSFTFVAGALGSTLVVTWTPPVGTIPPTSVAVPISTPLPVVGIINSGSARVALDDG